MRRKTLCLFPHKRMYETIILWITQFLYDNMVDMKCSDMKLQPGVTNLRVNHRPKVWGL